MLYKGDIMEYVNLPKTERGQKTLEKIVEAAEIVFYEKGYNGSTIRDISKEAGVSVGTIYIYFKDKKCIYDHLLEEYSKLIRSSISKRIEGVTSRKEAERLGILVFLEIAKEKKYIYNIIWESLYIDKGKFVDYYTNFAKNYTEQVEKAIGKGEMKDHDPEIVAWTLMGVSNFIGLRYVMFDDIDDLEAVATEVINVLDEGLFK